MKIILSLLLLCLSVSLADNTYYVCQADYTDINGSYHSVPSVDGPRIHLRLSSMCLEDKTSWYNWKDRWAGCPSFHNAAYTMLQEATGQSKWRKMNTILNGRSYSHKHRTGNAMKIFDTLSDCQVFLDEVRYGKGFLFSSNEYQSVQALVVERLEDEYDYLKVEKQ